MGALGLKSHGRWDRLYSVSAIIRNPLKETLFGKVPSFRVENRNSLIQTLTTET